MTGVASADFPQTRGTRQRSDALPQSGTTAAPGNDAVQPCPRRQDEVVHPSRPLPPVIG